MARWSAVVGLIILIALGGFAFWAKGRGYKTWVLARLWPNSKYAMKHPSVVASRPGDQEGGVAPDAFIACDVNLPNPGSVVDKNSLDGGVVLFRGNARELIPIDVNTSGGGDSIVIHPKEPLALNALYTIQILPAVHDTGGQSFQPYSASFSTAAGTVYSQYPVAAEKAVQAITQLSQNIPGSGIPSKSLPSYSGITVGPDHRVYANTTDGRILRYDIAPDGSLSDPTTITTIQASEGHGQGLAQRLITSVCFDPSSTATDLKAWVTHSAPVGRELLDWCGKLSLLSGPNLEHCQDYVIGLPRARLDHATNQCTVGPDGAIYFCQASNTAMGAFDPEWGKRGEHLLSACILRVDPKLIPSPPVDVKTSDGGHYDPYAPNAPVTLYATGTRNAYDLVWHSNGNLYAPLNGSARGGNTPATPAHGPYSRRFDQDLRGPYTGPIAPALTLLPTQNDYLIRVEKGGYYGHPNPTRAEYVLNGGNPTGQQDIAQVAQYPIGTPPDRNWRRPVFDFNKNLAPCGIIEYKGDAFPQLNGKLLVVRYSGGKDIIALTPSPDGGISEFITGIQGFTHFFDPVDLCEDPQSGYIYVAEYGGKRITLLRPLMGGLSQRVIRQDVGPVGATVTQPFIVTTAPGSKPQASVGTP